MKHGPENIQTLKLVTKLNKKKGLWRKVSEILCSSRRRRPEMNVGRLAKVTKAGDIAVLPGKLLSGGEIGHAVTIGCMGASASAKTKVEAAKGKVVALPVLFEKHADGKGVRLLK
ncbi:50S ribosomal protein L18e [Candidatus Micrarchaeota archaeon CG10_big_fil_rev_8_21_14_0_10_59_7]|nr:MAG: 50S ribosomal protein L18e [Candidatus Micrarchaeota archaeon CG10_big_fil_rev_8_21_14_0_10_59_7]